MNRPRAKRADTLAVALQFSLGNSLVGSPALRSLTNRELEVLEHLKQGARVSVIAAQLHISPHTVRNHLKSVFKKVGVKSQAELIEWTRTLDSAH